MPHSCEEPHDKYVECLMTAVASKGNVNIVAEEASERHVPSAPKVADAIAAIWMIKVLVEMESEAAAYTMHKIYPLNL